MTDQKYTHWSQEEEEQLRRLVNNDVPNNEISKRMDRSVYAITVDLSQLVNISLCLNQLAIHGWI